MTNIVGELWESFKGLPVIEGFFSDLPRVSVIRLSGVIADSSAMRKGSFSHHRIRKNIDRAFDKANDAVALIINSPGGSAAQTSLIASHIRRRAEEDEIPVYAFVEDVAASGGYWLACAADEIYAQESSIVGSIGVISASFGLDEFIAKHDIKRRVHTSGKDKSFMDPFMPETKTDVGRLSEIQKDIHEAFIDWVKERRTGKIKESDKTLFEGGFWAAGKAWDKGLIDGYGDIESVMKEKFGDKGRFIDCSPEKKSFLQNIMPFSGKLENTIADDLLASVEGRAYWSRFGL